MLFDQDDRLFLQRCQTSIVVPADAETSLDTILNGESDIQPRRTLYYDENVRLVVFFEVPTCSEEKLHDYISNIEVKVDVWATAEQNGDEKSPTDGTSKRDLVASVKVAKVDDPFTLIKATEEEVILQLAWEVRLDLGRPRLRALHQTVTFLPIASILVTDDDAAIADSLEPFTILESNVLGPLEGIPGVEEYPYLPASRLEKFVASKAPKDNRIRIRHVASDPIPAYTVAIPRLKYTRINTSMPYPSTIASLDVDMIPILDVRGVIFTVDVSLANGVARPLTPDSLPVSWKSRDCLSFLYDLQPALPQTELTEAENSTSASTANLNVDTISISINLRVDDSSAAPAIIRMSWSANVDFSLALNPSFGAPSQPLQRTNRPSSLNFTPQPDTSKLPKLPHKTSSSLTSARTASTKLQHQVIPTSIPRSDSSFIEVSFIAPAEPIYCTLPFSWRVLIVNNSGKAVKLAVVPLPRIQRPTNTTQQFAKRHAPKASNASLSSFSRSMNQMEKGHNRNALSTAKAVVDEQVLYALHHQTASAAPVDADLVSLTSELRIGPLGAGQCYETELQFVAWKSGTFSIDAIRIVDLAKESEGGVGMINDIRDLPEVVVTEAPVPNA